MPSRRAFLGVTVAGAATVTAGARQVRAAAEARRERRASSPAKVLRPPRLRRGDAVALINPCSVPFEPGDLEAVRGAVETLGLRLVEAPAVHEPRETAEARAADINAMFADGRVNAALPLR